MRVTSVSILASSSADVSLPLTSYSKLKWKYVNFQSNSRPYLNLQVRLPDNRLKFIIRNKLLTLYADMVNHVQILLKNLILIYIFFSKQYKLYSYRQTTSVTTKTQLEKLDLILQVIKDLLKSLENFFEINLVPNSIKFEIAWEEKYIAFSKKTIVSIKCKHKIIKSL